MNKTIKEIAKIAGVSPSAVSKILNGRPGFKTDTILKIKNIAAELGYFPYCKPRTKGLSRDSQKYIGVITTPGDYSIREPLDRALEDFFAKAGYNIIKFIFSARDSKTINMDLIRSNITENREIAGLISITIPLSGKIISELRENEVPVVVVDQHIDYGSCVYVNNQKAVSDAVDKLVSLNHKKIGFISPEPVGHGYDVWAERLNGYKKAISKNRLKFDPGLLGYENTFNKELVIIATKKLIKMNRGISAIIYTSDKMAIPGMKAITESGLKVPDDISVIGFDDLEFDEYLSPELSSIRQPAYDMGEKAAKMLYNAIMHKNFRYEAVSLNTELVIRSSVIKFSGKTARG